jgi:hypothetical protein
MKIPLNKLTILLATLGLAMQPLLAQEAIQPDLRGVPAGKGWKLFNRAAMAAEKDGQPAVRLEDCAGIGVAWLENFSFTNGTIELDIRGTNVTQHSFVGVAFHGKDVSTYDAVYFRPFNFNTKDTARRQRAVQYISHPTHTWSKLREEQPGKYEQPVAPAPDPNGWFHVRVVVAHPKVSVFVNDAKEPCLVVDQLGDRKSGRIGLWVDTGGGEFANLKIK